MPGKRLPAGECQFAKSAMADERRALNVLSSSIIAKWPTPDMITTSIPYRLAAAESVGYTGELIPAKSQHDFDTDLSPSFGRRATRPIRTAYTMNSRAKTRIPTLPNTTPKPFSMTLAGRYFPTRLPMVLPIKTPGILQPTTCHTGCAESA